MSYLDLNGFKDRTVIPSEDVDQVEISRPGWTLAALAEAYSKINSVLAKRYAVPFAVPVSEIVKRWEARLVTPYVLMRRGVNPSDAQFIALQEDAKAAWDEITAAANSQTSMFDLPLSSSDTTSGVVAGGPIFYSEASPYEWTTIQRLDANGR